MKTCDVCGNRLRSDNKYGVCGSRNAKPECKLEYGRRFREPRHDMITTSKREYHEANRDERLAQMREYGTSLSGKAQALLYHARLRAKRDGLTCTLTLEWVETELASAVENGCPLLGIPIVLDAVGLRPNSPSIDKFYPELGYTPENCMIVSHRANAIKRDATIGELSILTDNVIRLARERFHA